MWWRAKSGGTSSVVGFGQKDRTAYKHPASFPQALAEDHIRTWSNPGDVVLDPTPWKRNDVFGCLTFGSSFIGIDVSREYCELACRRLACQCVWPERKAG